MFDVKNTFEVTKSAVAQLIGKNYMDKSMALTELNDQYIVDLGEKLEITEDGEVTNGSPADVFFKALIGQIGKIVVDTRSYVAQLPKLFVDPLNWGIIAEYIKIDTASLMEDPMWDPNGFINFTDEGGEEYAQKIAALEHGCYKPKVSARIYKKAKAIMVALTVAREQMFTAFQGVEQLNSFIAGLHNSVENTLQLKAEVYALMTVSMGAAVARANDNEINLLEEYKAIKPDATTTVTNWEKDADFLRFMAFRISETKDNMRRYTALYNDHESISFSAETNVILLNKFAKALAFNMEADVYHDNKVGIGDFDTVSAWQAVSSNGTTDKFSFATASTISLTEEAAQEAGISNPAENKTISGLVAVIYDRMAMGITIDKKKVTSSYTAVTDYTSFFSHHALNYLVNPSYGIVTFVIK